MTSFDDQAAPDDQSAAAGQPTPDDQTTPDDQAGAGYQAAVNYEPLVDYEPFADYAAADATRAEPAAGPDPLFASWYRQDNPTETVQVTPTEPLAPPREYQQPQGYQLPPGGQGGPSGPPFPAARPPQGNGRRGLFAVIAVVLVLAAGGGAYALASSLGKHPVVQPTASATGQAGTASATASPAASLVSVGPGVASSAAEPAVETLLSHYFDGIDTHDYPEYAATLTPAEQAQQTQSEFDSGYATTTDSGMTLTSLTGNGSGGPVATVTFTSRQSPAKSVDGSACNDWTLSLYLVPQGSGYLIGPAPSSYKPSYSDC